MFDSEESVALLHLLSPTFPHMTAEQSALPRFLSHQEKLFAHLSPQLHHLDT